MFAGRCLKTAETGGGGIAGNRHLILKTFIDNAIETAFGSWQCRENCSQWILQNYEDVREPYGRSMLCLVLGFRANVDVIPFLMRQVERFETQFPVHSFDQAPLLALYEIRARFLVGLSSNPCIIRTLSFLKGSDFSYLGKTSP